VKQGSSRPNSALCQIIHFAGVRRFGEVQDSVVSNSRKLFAYSRLRHVVRLLFLCRRTRAPDRCAPNPALPDYRSTSTPPNEFERSFWYGQLHLISRKQRSLRNSLGSHLVIGSEVTELFGNSRALASMPIGRVVEHLSVCLSFNSLSTRPRHHKSGERCD
jgi:hypothetical protein